MSQNFQFPNNQGGTSPLGQAYGPPPVNPYPPNQTGGGRSTLTIILVIVGIIGVLGLVMCGIMAALLIPAVSAAREAAARAQDKNNLKQIGLAVLNYESAYRQLPAPQVINADRVPVYAWSIPLLPFMEQDSLYRQIDFTNMQPWDSHENSGLFERTAPPMLQSFRSKSTLGSNDCHVFLISAPQLVRGNTHPMFIDGQWGKLSDVIDGLSNTIMAIQLVKYSVPWASPKTLTVDEAYQLIQNEDKIFHVLMGDASVIALPTSIDRQSFDALVTRDGQESISPSQFQAD